MILFKPFPDVVDDFPGKDVVVVVPSPPLPKSRAGNKDGTCTAVTAKEKKKKKKTRTRRPPGAVVLIVSQMLFTYLSLFL